MAIIKPDLTRIWAEGAIPSNVIDPDVTTPGSFSDGWEAEIPSFQHFNSLQQGFTTATAYNNEQGINEWDEITTYPVNAYAKASNGVLYIALEETTNQNPLSNPFAWQVAVDVNDPGVRFEGSNPDPDAQLNRLVTGVNNEIVRPLPDGQVGQLLSYTGQNSAPQWIDPPAAPVRRLPPGSVIYFASETPPPFFLHANGAVVLRADFPDLFAAIGTSFRIGVGAVSFALPNLRGQFIRGWSGGIFPDNGRSFGSFQPDLIRSHFHLYNGGPLSAPVAAGAQPDAGNSSNTVANRISGSAGGVETRPRNIALLSCIAY